jgi:hypothetical protein
MMRLAKGLRRVVDDTVFRVGHGIPCRKGHSVNLEDGP